MTKTFLLFALFLTTFVCSAQDTLSVIKTARNVVTIDISDAYAPFIYISDSTARKNTINDIAVLHKTGWTAADIKRLSAIIPLRTSVSYIDNSILKGNTTQTYQPYARNHQMYDFIESAMKNSKLRSTEIFQQAKKSNDKAVASAFEPWLLIVLDLSTYYKEAEIRTELKKRNITRVYFDIRGKAPKRFDEDDYFSSDPVAPVPPSPPPAPEKVVTIVDEQAEFPGGTSAFKKYMETNLIYPQTAKEAGIEGKVFVRFVVEKDGKITEVMVTKKLTNCPECDKEAVRLAKKMPNWIPGKVQGKAVSSYFNLPVEFKLK